ncbi:MAG: alpha/beta fold hydrolase [Acidimicrobiia bacterium]|nr:alpha/beta fold hydrolase [Acidimicrobiia bacterium]
MAAANGIELCHQTYGDPTDPPMLLVMGLGAQMILWPEELVLGLAAGGRYVIRFDNRDVGLSTKTPGPPPDVLALMIRRTAGGEVGPADVPYTLSDMAADAAGLLDALGIERADVVGASMGGMIVQHLAIEHPQRVRSVTSIMSTTGNPAVGQASPEAIGALLRPPPANRDEAIVQGMAASKVISGPLWDPDDARRRAAESYDRMFHPAGPAFQLAAIVASGDRTERLGSVQTSFLVVHGRVDPLIDVSGGVATADAVPGAELVLFDEMGHNLPRPLFPQLIDAIDGIASRI